MNISNFFSIKYVLTLIIAIGSVLTLFFFSKSEIDKIKEENALLKQRVSLLESKASMKVESANNVQDNEVVNYKCKDKYKAIAHFRAGCEASVDYEEKARASSAGSMKPNELIKAYCACLTDKVNVAKLASEECTYDISEVHHFVLSQKAQVICNY